MNLEQIRRYWEQAGKSFPYGKAVTPTTRDPYLGMLEEHNILPHLREDLMVLDVGCGDGYHTHFYADKVNRIVGIDVSKSLINIAKKGKSPNASFLVGSVLNLDKYFEEQSFDCVISQRCLINLPTWRYQRQAIKQLRRILRNNGVFLLTEGFKEPLDALNTVRQSIGLYSIKVVDYNHALSISLFEHEVRKEWNIIMREHYGFYLFMSRTFHPLLVNPEEPKHDAPINNAIMTMSKFVETPELKKYSYNLFYALKKR